jgi:curved DNA-binding protein CbpA
MSDYEFIDYYEVLKISPDADPDTLEHAFRCFARRYHPDNLESGDRALFGLILQAHDTLKDPVSRAQYDLEHRQRTRGEPVAAEQAGEADMVGSDVEIQRRMLTLFYTRRRKQVREPGIGDAELASVLGHPIEHIAFNLWYMEEKQWIRKIECGSFAITAEGVDRAAVERNLAHDRRLLSSPH